MEIIKNLKSTLLCGALIVLSLLVPSAFQTSVLLVAIILGSYKQTREGLEDSLENKRINVELLMILSAIGAVLINEAMEGATLVFIFSLSGELEAITSDRSHKEIRKLLNQQPQKARVKNKDGAFDLVDLDTCSVGTEVFILKGETIPLDGVIVEGSSDFDEAMITGESLPRSKTIAHQVFAGSINLTAPITIQTTHESQDVMIQKIVRMVEESEKNESRSAQVITKIETYYSTAIILIVLITYLILKFAMGWNHDDAFYRSIILLVVASPCALIASVTPATIAAIAASAKKGVLIKGGTYLDSLKDIKAVAFDKTGTLTSGKPHIENDYFLEDVHDVVGSIESHSTHPLAEAITLKYGSELQDEILNIRDINGIGMQAQYNGDLYSVGKYQDHILDVKLLSVKNDMEHDGLSIVYVTKNHELIGIIGLSDTIRDESVQFVKTLKSLNIEPIMITGDHTKSAQKVADAVCIERVYANCLPDEKVNAIKNLMNEYGDVLMIGDGINDAPSLASATIGVSIGSGSDLAIESSDIVLINSNLNNLAEVIKISQKLAKITRQNIIFALSVILCLIVLNMLGFLNLPMAVIGHEGSTILVILNGLRMLKSNP